MVPVGVSKKKTILAETEHNLQEILNEVNCIGKMFDMKMNANKTRPIYKPMYTPCMCIQFCAEKTMPESHFNRPTATGSSVELNVVESP